MGGITGVSQVSGLIQEALGRRWPRAGFRAARDSEGWVVNAPAYPSIFLWPEAVGRGRLRRGQVQDWLQNNLQEKGIQGLLGPGTSQAL